MPNPKKITIYYDGDCPVCHTFVHFLRLKEMYDLTLISMRESASYVVEFDERGINLDE